MFPSLDTSHLISPTVAFPVLLRQKVDARITTTERRDPSMARKAYLIWPEQPAGVVCVVVYNRGYADILPDVITRDTVVSI